MLSFRELKQGEFIQRCSAILSNGVQCPRAGEFQVVTEDGKEAYQQICTRCKALIEAGHVDAPKVYPSAKPEEDQPKKEVLKPQVEDSQKKNPPPPSNANPPSANKAASNPVVAQQGKGVTPAPTAPSVASTPSAIAQASSDKAQEEKKVTPNVTDSKQSTGSSTDASTAKVSGSTSSNK